MKHHNNSENLTFQNDQRDSNCNCGESDSTEICINCDLNEMIKMFFNAEIENDILESLEDDFEDFEGFDELDYFAVIEIDDYHNENSFSVNKPTETMVSMPYPNYTTTFRSDDVEITYTLKISN